MIQNSIPFDVELELTRMLHGCAYILVIFVVQENPQTHAIFNVE